MTDDRNAMLIARVGLLMEAERQFNSYHGSDPVPAWLKWVREERLLMGFVNAAYTAATGITCDAYRGRPDKAMWDGADDETFAVADQEVIRTKRPVHIAEYSATGRPCVWHGWKWGYMLQGDVIGVWGRARRVDLDLYLKMLEIDPELPQVTGLPVSGQ